MSTPNRITFSPGRDTPINPFHTRELNAAELTELLTDNGFAVEAMLGVFHGPRLRRTGRAPRRLDHRRADRPRRWPTRRGRPTCWRTSRRSPPADFDLVDASDRDIDDSLDLVAIAVRP